VSRRQKLPRQSDLVVLRMFGGILGWSCFSGLEQVLSAKLYKRLISQVSCFINCQPINNDRKFGPKFVSGRACAPWLIWLI